MSSNYVVSRLQVILSSAFTPRALEPGVVATGEEPPALLSLSLVPDQGLRFQKRLLRIRQRHLLP
jgi:hypothetical protein